MRWPDAKRSADGGESPCAVLPAATRRRLTRAQVCGRPPRTPPTPAVTNATLTNASGLRAAPQSSDSAAARDGVPGAVRRATISVVIPARNEAPNLPHVLPRLPAGIDEVILVDGHSIDDTVTVARAICPTVRVVHQDRLGKGNALACGFAAAVGDIIVMLDADGSTDPAEIPRFVAALLAGHDFAKGSRFAAGGGSADLTRARRVGNRALNVLVNVLFGTGYTDLCYGYNAFWRHCLPDLDVTCDGFEVETLINIRVAQAGLRVVEVPSIEYQRVFGESSLRACRDGLRILRTIVSERVRLSGHRRRGRRQAAAHERTGAIHLVAAMAAALASPHGGRMCR